MTKQDRTFNHVKTALRYCIRFRARTDAKHPAGRLINWPLVTSAGENDNKAVE